MKTKLSALEQHNATVEALGYAVGRAMPLLAQFPPTDFENAGFLCMKLDELYNEISTTPKDGMLHITQAFIVLGILEGVREWQRTQPIRNSGTH